MTKQQPSWLGTAPAIAETDISETLQTDVVVCGAGLAGVAAARTTVEAGKTCVLLEKCSDVQGRSGQFAVIGGKFIERWHLGTESRQKEIVDALMAESGPNVKREIFEYAVAHSGADFDWYMEGFDGTVMQYPGDAIPKDAGLNVTMLRYPVPEAYDPRQEEYPVYPGTVMLRPGHMPVLKRNFAMAMETGRLTARFDTPAVELIREEETGRVSGVLAKKPDGSYLRALARGGVVLTTGDYAGNKEMFAADFPEFTDHPIMSCGVTKDKKRANTGDGHKMGMWIGAKLEDGPHCINAHNMGGAMGVTPYLLLNQNGERFMNEDVPGHIYERAIMNLPGKIAWQIFDSAWPEQIPYMPMGHGAACMVLPEGGNDHAGPMDSFASQKSIDREVERGSTVKADTLEELVEKAGLPKTAIDSILRYNALAKAGADTDFGKKASRMFPLEKAPFYASRIGIAPVLCCHSGLVSDADCRCYGEDGAPIPGLFVAGNVQGSRFSRDYPTVLPGLSHTMALTMGRRAGENAANAAAE